MSSEAITRLQREIAALKKVITARDHGIPERLVVMLKGKAANTPEGRVEAVKKALARYGIATEEDAEAAGCILKFATLPWLEPDTRNIPSLDDLPPVEEMKQTDTMSVVETSPEANTSTASGSVIPNLATSQITDIPQ